MESRIVSPRSSCGSTGSSPSGYLRVCDSSTPTWYHNLPEKVLVEIFKYFTQKELKVFMLVCQKWSYAAQNPRLWKSLTIVGPEVPTYFICKKIRGWTRLEAVRAENVFDPATLIRQVCRCVPGVRHLAIRHCVPVPESAVRFAIRSCSRLESLDLSGTHVKGGTFYKELATLAELKKLNLSGNPYLTTKNLITAILNARNVTDLRISKYVCKTDTLTDDDATLIFLSLSDKLTSVSFDCTSLSASTFGVILSCKKLQRLCLYGATNLYGNQFASIWRYLPNLTKLKVTNAHQIADTHVLELFEKGQSVMKNLLVLDLSGCWKITDNSVKTITEVSAFLEILSLKSCKSITNLEPVRDLRNLHMLNVAFLTNLRLETIFPLPANLRTVYVDENEKTLGWIKSLEEDGDDEGRLEVRICLSEFNKSTRAADL